MKTSAGIFLIVTNILFFGEESRPQRGSTVVRALKCLPVADIKKV